MTLTIRLNPSISMFIPLTNQWHNKNRFEFKQSTAKDHDHSPISAAFRPYFNRIDRKHHIFSYPIDPGHTKTWHGLADSLLITRLSALMIGYDLETGILVASGAMGGDILSNFSANLARV